MVSPGFQVSFNIVLNLHVVTVFVTVVYETRHVLLSALKRSRWELPENDEERNEILGGLLSATSVSLITVKPNYRNRVALLRPAESAFAAMGLV